MGLNPVQTIALCAGSGSTVFKSLSKPVDMLLTGELSHHEVLAAVQRCQHVVLCGHTNTERGYLKILQRKLQEDLNSAVGPAKIEVGISASDRHPLKIM